MRVYTAFKYQAVRAGAGRNIIIEEWGRKSLY